MMRQSIRYGFLVVFAMAAVACSGKGAPHASRDEIPEAAWSLLQEDGTRPSETGVASYYGKGFHGRKTANGERFNMAAMTAAHRTLPLGTVVRVENLDNHTSVVLKINDRGPFIKGRILDVSQGAAKVLGFVHRGTTDVKITPLIFPEQWDELLAIENTAQAHDGRDPVTDGADVERDYSIKVARFDEKKVAVDLEKDLQPFFGLARVSPSYIDDRVYWQVMVGRYESRREAQADLKRLREFGHRGVVKKWKE